jgi:RNA polymerase sigma factor (sigma-70 family)
LKQQQLLELYDTYSNNVFRLAMSFLGNTADSEDIVQSVFTKLIEKKPHISKGKEKSYLLTMTANMCRNHLKSAANRLNSSYEELTSELTDSGFKNDLSIGFIDGFNIEEHAMYEAFAQISDTYRTVLYLHYYEGYKFGEIAKMLHISSSAVSMRISRGRQELKEILSSEL